MEWKPIRKIVALVCGTVVIVIAAYHGINGLLYTAGGAMIGFGLDLGASVLGRLIQNGKPGAGD